MKIINQRLYHDDGSPYRFQLSPNISPGTLKPEFLIIHYTAGQTLQGAVIWLTSKQSQVSSHLAIGRDGTIVGMVPFDRIAWHAGVSEWGTRKRLNLYSIGIELDNAGMLKWGPKGWSASFGRTYPAGEVLQAVHKFGTQTYGWHTYTPEQIEACAQVAALLVREYGIKEILGHDDIAPRRKWDPGPAFPMDDFRSRVAALVNTPLPPGGGGTPPVPPPVPTDQPPARRIPVLEYHDTEFSASATAQMHTEWFLPQLRWLYENGYRTLTGGELVRFATGQDRPVQRSVVLRFDVSSAIYQNLRDVIVPALKQYSLHAIFFLLTGMVRDSNVDRCVSWDNLREWEATGLVEFGSLGMNYPDYRTAAGPLRLKDARDSKLLIESKLGHPIDLFAFPKDSAQANPQLLLKPLGYKLAFDGPRMERSVVFNDPNPYALPCYYPFSDPKRYPAIYGMKDLDFGGMMQAAVA